MACSHLNKQANEKINELKKEQENYTNAQNEMNEIKSIVESYKAYFARVSTYLGYIIVNYKPFQQEGCNAQVTKLEGVIKELDALIQDLKKAEEKIKEEIDAQRAIINSGTQCSSCKAAEARRLEESKNRRNSGSRGIRQELME